MHESRKWHIEVGDFVEGTLPYFDATRVGILMFQQEFAARLVARPGDAEWPRMSANVELYAEVNVVMNVGRDNFRPPPKVESTIVRLVSRDPLPQVEYSEFDGLARIVSAGLRPHKTVHANFMVKGPTDLAEKNRKAWASVDGVVSEDDSDGKKKVEEGCGSSRSRAPQMDINDLLKLLLAFHDAGIHFA